SLRDKIDKEFELLIIGDGPDYNFLQSMINDLNLENIATLLGSMTQERIKDYFSSSDIFLFPGICDPDTRRCETQGLVIQEAQAMEVPVVVSDVGGMKYGLIDGVTGFVVKEGG